MSDRPQNLVCPTAYPWAFNKLKLNQAYSFLVYQRDILGNKNVDPENEEQVKERYLAIKGLTTDAQKENLRQDRPKSTSNVDRRPRTRTRS